MCTWHEVGVFVGWSKQNIVFSKRAPNPYDHVHNFIHIIPHIRIEYIILYALHCIRHSSNTTENSAIQHCGPNTNSTLWKQQNKTTKQKNRPKQIETLVSSGPILHIIFYNTSTKKKAEKRILRLLIFFLFFLLCFFVCCCCCCFVQVFLPTYARDAAIGFERVHSTNLELQVVGRNGGVLLLRSGIRNRIGDICMLLEGLGRIASFWTAFFVGFFGLFWRFFENIFLESIFLESIFTG